MNKFLNAIKWQFKSNLGIILFMLLFWVCINLIILTITSLTPFPYDHSKNVISIASCTVTNNKIVASANGFGILKGIEYISAGIGALIYFSIFSIVLINKLLINEGTQKTIGIWFSFPISRGKIFFSKILSIIIPELFAWVSIFIFSILLSAFAIDAKENIHLIVVMQLNFLFTLMLLNSLYLFCFILIKNSTTSNIIGSLILIILTVQILISIITDAQIIYMSNTSLKIIKYTSLVSLITDYKINDIGSNIINNYKKRSEIQLNVSLIEHMSS